MYLDITISLQQSIPISPTPQIRTRWNSIKLQITIPARNIPDLLFSPRRGGRQDGEKVERSAKGISAEISERSENARYIRCERHFWRASSRTPPLVGLTMRGTIETRHSDCVLLLPEYLHSIRLVPARTNDSDSASLSTAMLPSLISIDALIDTDAASRLASRYHSSH